jgi:ABC-type dipeptide/oligopeptide/nickel transport system ATPase subunit
MITIEIKGPAGEGKTTTAIAIMRLLRDLKQEVKLQGSRAERDRIEQYAKEPASQQAKQFKEKRKFLVIDQDL